MKNIVVVFIFCLVSSKFLGQERKYLLYTDENVALLKAQIKTNQSIKDSWDVQYKNAKKLLKEDKLKPKDGLLLGLIYRVTGEEKFANKLKELLVKYTSKKTWEGKTLLNRNPPWIGGLGTSHTSYDIAVGFDCIYNYLTTSEKEQIAKGIVRLGIEPARHDWLEPATNMHTYDTMGHNWWSACVYMSGLASLAVRNEIPEATKWAEEVEQSALEWMNYSGSVLQNKPATFDKDGGFYESVWYGTYGTSQYLLFRYAYSNVWPDAPKVESSILEKIGHFFINTTYFVEGGKDMAVNFGDSNIMAHGDRIVRLLWHLGYKNQDYEWYMNHVTNGESKDSHPVEALILNPDKNRDSKYSLNRSTSHLYKDMGWATLRNSWNDNATMLAIKSGFTWNHAHADAGSYILFHNGKNLIIDSGTGSYLNPLFTEYYCQSEAHNVVMFDGKGQNRKDPYFGNVTPGSLHNLVEGKDFKYILANATGPYSHILTRNYRNFIWVGNVILVIDDLLAHEPGQFEWLLHYNGESELKGGIDLTIKDEGAGIRVRPLYPKTFPPGGERPHDFPEHMRLAKKIGYEDHHPENEKPYWAISHFEKTARTKFVTAIILEDENKVLPTIKKFEGKDFIGVSITQGNVTTDLYFNLLADGRLKHRNSVIEMNGWQTDAYLTVLKYAKDTDKTKIENVQEAFMAHGSYLRRNNQVLLHSLSKCTALVEDLQSAPKVIFQGQENAVLRVYSNSESNNILLNDKVLNGEFDSSNQFIKLKIKE